MNLNFKSAFKTLKPNYLVVVFIFFSLFLVFSNNESVFSANKLKNELTASSAILIDAENGEILFELNSNSKKPNASTTKMLTGILALENIDINKKIKASKYACDTGESEIYLSEGEALTVEELIYSILLKSANDSSVVLAEAISGSEKDFVKLMNTKAKLMGAKNTNFTNPHGLHDENHYSTAYDLASIAKYAINNKKFLEIVGTKKKIIPWEGNPYKRELINHNDLVLKYDWVKGIKTGFTENAGHCLIALGVKDGVRLITVVLNSNSSEDCYNDTLKLFEHGFTNFELKIYIEKNGVIKKMVAPFWDKEINILAKNEVKVRINKSEDRLGKIIKINSMELPIKKGDVIGSVMIKRGGMLLGETELISSEYVRKPNLWEKLNQTIRGIFKRRESKALPSRISESII